MHARYTVHINMAVDWIYYYILSHTILHKLTIIIIIIIMHYNLLSTFKGV